MRKLVPYNEVLSFNAEYNLELGSVGVSRGLFQGPSVTSDDLMELGLFGGGNNANTFYPGTDVRNDVLVKPEDFVRVPFRLLSATIVGAGGWKATDFSNEAVLKASMNKLKSKPIFFDHDQELLNWVGVVESVSWEASYTDSDGNKIPAGINGIMLIDGKTNPKIVRGIQMGAVFSNSVTVSMEWEPSHTFESMEEFYDQLGKYASDGKMVARKVTGIKDYFESSLVWLGADPYAKLINNDGELVNPDLSHAVSFKKATEDIRKTYENDKKFAISFCLNKNTLYLSKQNSNKKPENKITDMEKLIALMITLGFFADENAMKTMLGLDATAEVTKEALEQFLKAERKDPEAKPDSRIAAFDALSGMAVIGEGDAEVELSVDSEGISSKTHKLIALDTFKRINEDAEALAELNVEELQDGEGKLDKEHIMANVSLGKSYIEMKRKEVKRLYKLAAGDAKDDAVLGLMDKANPEELDGLLKQHVNGATAKFSGSCKKCGSTEFSFKSTVDAGEQGKTDSGREKRSLRGIADKKTSSSMFMGGPKTEAKKEE